MRIVSFNEATQFDLKEKIPAFRGKITRINKRNTGTNERGVWSFQTVELSDPDNQASKLRVKIWNRNEIPQNWGGRVVLLQSGEGERGLKGMTMEQDTYKWQEGQPIKKQVDMRCDDGASFELAGEAPQGAQNSPAPTRQQAASAPQQSASTQTASPAPASPAASQRAQAQEPARQLTKEEKDAERAEKYRVAIVEAGHFIGRKISGFALVLRAMDKLQAARTHNGTPIPPEAIQGMTTSIFIAGDRAFQWDKLPTTLDDLEKFFPQSKATVNQPPTQ